jgi:hypothetical protein
MLAQLWKSTALWRYQCCCIQNRGPRFAGYACVSEQQKKGPLVPLCGISPGVRGYINSGSAFKPGFRNCRQIWRRNVGTIVEEHGFSRALRIPQMQRL